MTILPRGTSMEPITLDLRKPEYDEQFSSQDLWQRQAATALLKHLKRFGKQASIHKSPNTGQNIHNAILISGDRGTGKSVFLKNVEDLWKAHVKTDNTLPKLFFTPLIDPTLLQDHDSFTNVLVAHIYNQVTDTLNSFSCQQQSAGQEKNKQHFYKVLRSLAEAIEQPGERSDHTGLDKIIQYSSGIKIDTLFHEFVAAAKKILDCAAIVLPIDDVDMALDKAYPVLEEIRRRLSCPEIIPIVSGDLELYQHLVKLELTQSLKNKLANSPEESLYGDEKSEKLAEAYLTKVLPNHYRIALQPIEDLVSHLTIIDPDISSDDKNKSYIKYQSELKQYFFGLINGKEKSVDYPLPNSAREIGQLIRLLPPSKLTDETEPSNRKLLEDWESMRIWSEGMRHGASYVLARSAIQLIHKSEPFRISQLMAFNIKEQAVERSQWAQYDFITEQSIYAEEFDKKTNDFLLSHTITDKILRSMPPLEMHTDNMSITGSNAKEDPNPLALAIYTNWAYYSTQGYQQRKIFFSRAFDLLATSLLMAATPTETNQKWTNKFKEIIDTVPFYSIHSLNPTKTIEEQLTAEQKTGDIPELDNSENTTIHDFSEGLTRWAEENKKDVQAYLGDSTQLIALLSAVFNKAFSQLNILRGKYHKGENTEDTLLDAILRFRYILTNAFGFFIKPTGVVPANLALTTAPSTLREKVSFANSSSTYNRNVGWIDAENSDEVNGATVGVATETIEEPSNVRFLKAVFNHPIFTELGITINSCISEKSALITNSSGTPRRPSATGNQTKTKIKKRGIRFNSITEIAGKDKENANPESLLKSINSGEAERQYIIALFDKLIEERGSKELADYAKNHQDIYHALDVKISRDNNE